MKSNLKSLSINDLCSFNKVPNSVLQNYGVSQVFLDVGFDTDDGKGLFGKDPDVYYCKTDIHASDFRLEGSGGIYIVDGSMNVDGTFVLTAADAYTVLVVLGDLKVSHDLIHQMDSQLVIFGHTAVGGTMWINLSDAGFTVFRGPVSASRWYQTNDSVENSLLFQKAPNGKKISEQDSDFKNCQTLFESYCY